MVRRWMCAAIAGALVSLVRGTIRTAATAGAISKSADFVAGCTLPFAAIQDHHSIDDACTIAGDLRNNFCATGTPMSATWNTFKKLQQKMDALPAPFTYGSHDTLPADRTPIRSNEFYISTNGDEIHEGTLVRTVAFLLHGAYSNSGTGEGMNCGIHRVESNDIHLALARTKSEPDECDSFTAEITPHFRPAEWLILSSLHKTATKTAAQRIAVMDLDRPLRLTGQMMMDGSHKPCTPGHSPLPKRISVWEIHPVYAIDVCKKRSVSSCRRDVDNDWEPLNVFVSHDEE